jgi:carboxylesterase type B
LVTDRLYLSGIGESARLHQAAAPVYFYYYTYKSLSKEHQKECLGIGHGEDMLLYKNRKFPYTSDEETIIESMLDMYESFSSTGYVK